MGTVIVSNTVLVVMYTLFSIYTRRWLYSVFNVFSRLLASSTTSSQKPRSKRWFHHTQSVTVLVHVLIL